VLDSLRLSGFSRWTGAASARQERSGRGRSVPGHDPTNSTRAPPGRQRLAAQQARARELLEPLPASGPREAIGLERVAHRAHGVVLAQARERSAHDRLIAAARAGVGAAAYPPPPRPSSRERTRRREASAREPPEPTDRARCDERLRALLRRDARIAPDGAARTARACRRTCSSWARSITRRTVSRPSTARARAPQSPVARLGLLRAREHRVFRGHELREALPLVHHAQPSIRICSAPSSSGGSRSWSTDCAWKSNVPLVPAQHVEDRVARHEVERLRAPSRRRASRARPACARRVCADCARAAAASSARSRVS
jgi:hypothetical protein